MNIQSHYTTVKLILGAYLLWHFTTFEAQHFDELFGKDRPFTSAYAVLPNIPNGLLMRFSIITLCALFTISDYFRNRVLSSLLAGSLFLVWMLSLNQNPFISNPGMPYVGWLLLVFMVSPFLNAETKLSIYYIAWFLMALGYTVSGLHKLQCPSWLDGTALTHVLQSPLARDNFLVTWLLQSSMLKLLTWSSLFLEITFLPLGCFYYTKNLYWFMYLGFHLGILMTINFVDLTLGVLMIHVFTFDFHLIKLKFY